MKNTRKKYAVLAVLLAASMLVTGCGGDDSTSAEETSLSINVIGDNNSVGDGTAADSVEVTMEGDDAAETPAETAAPVVVTDEAGEAVTGVNGDVLTEPPVTTAPPATDNRTEEEILAQLTATTPPLEKPTVTQKGSVRYAYDSLTAREKELYDKIVDGIENLGFIICEEDEYTVEEWIKIYSLVYNQEARLFYMGPKIKVGKLFYLTKDTEAINKMQKEIDAVADKIVAEANGKATTFEKLQVFHDYLVYNSTFELNEDKTTANYNASIYNAFGSGEPQGNIQCVGYAKAVQYLCDKADIACMVVTGETATGQTHAWNVVDVEGKWYNFDVTWDDPILSTPNYKNIRYNYFLVPDSYMDDITHFHRSQKKTSSGDYIKLFDPPACTDTAQNYFVKNNLVYSDFASAEAALKAEIEKAAKDGTRTAQIMVSSKEIYNQIYDARMDYNTFSKSFDGVKGLSDECNEAMLLIEFDVIYK